MNPSKSRGMVLASHAPPRTAKPRRWSDWCTSFPVRRSSSPCSRSWAAWFSLLRSLDSWFRGGTQHGGRRPSVGVQRRSIEPLTSPRSNFFDPASILFVASTRFPGIRAGYDRSLIPNRLDRLMIFDLDPRGTIIGRKSWRSRKRDQSAIRLHSHLKQVHFLFAYYCSCGSKSEPPRSVNNNRHKSVADSTGCRRQGREPAWPPGRRHRVRLGAA